MPEIENILIPKNSMKGKFSLTIGGIIVMIAGTFLVELGFSEGCSGEITSKVPLLVGGVMAWIGRVRRGDVNIFGVKK